MPIKISPSTSSDIGPSNEDSTSKTYTYSHEGASYIAVHFSTFDFPNGCVMNISDSNGDQSYELTGRGVFDQGTFWPRQVNGKCDIIDKLRIISIIPSYPANRPLIFVWRE